MFSTNIYKSGYVLTRENISNSRLDFHNKSSIYYQRYILLSDPLDIYLKFTCNNQSTDNTKIFFEIYPDLLRDVPYAQRPGHIWVKSVISDPSILWRVPGKYISTVLDGVRNDSDLYKYCWQGFLYRKCDVFLIQYSPLVYAWKKMKYMAGYRSESFSEIFDRES